MVGNKQSSNFDYALRYDEFWTNDNRIENINTDFSALAERIITTCGSSNMLDIGAGAGLLVRKLLSRGVDAHGVDVSKVAVEHCRKYAGSQFIQGSILELPFKDGEFSTVISINTLSYILPEDIPQALAEIYRVSQKNVFLQITTIEPDDEQLHLTVRGRAWWEERFFEAGFRKHPAYYIVNDYESLNMEGSEIYLLLEKLPFNALALYPLSALDEERNLYMDMLRATGSRSDAHVGRYHFASKYVRPGDVVLDAACGLGYGSHLLSKLTKGGSFQGVDGSPYAIQYAKACFGESELVSFIEGYLPQCLSNIEDNSIDVVVCFETLEHVEDPLALIEEFHRILSPGGRFISSVPHDWSDETGSDPNPYHFHVYDISKFESQLTRCFDIEQLFGQTADRVKLANENCEWAARPRSWIEIDLRNLDRPIESEWLIAIAAKSPLDGRNVSFTEKMYSLSEHNSNKNVLAFNRDYENPWLIKSLISIGLRTENKLLRATWARETLAASSPRSADTGAALCVLAYLEVENRGNASSEFLTAIDDYIYQGECSNANALRWQVSLAYVRALLALNNGHREEAKKYFYWLIGAPVATYSVTLLTKLAESAYILGLMEASDNNFDLARKIWRQAINTMQCNLAEHFLSASPDTAVFVHREISLVMLFTARLQSAQRSIEAIQSAPHVFYEQVFSDYLSQIKNISLYSTNLEVANKAQADQIKDLKLHVGNLETAWQTHTSQISELRTYIKDLEDLIKH